MRSCHAKLGWTTPCASAALVAVVISVATGCLESAVQGIPAADTATPDSASDAGPQDSGTSLDSDVADLSRSDPGVTDSPGDIEDAPVVDGMDAAEDPDVGAPDSDGGGPSTGTVRYPTDRVHSPLTSSLIDGLEAVLGRGSGLQDDVFMKVGDSITIDTDFLTCLASGTVSFPDGEHLSATLEYFRGGDAAGSTPFDRSSEAAESGRTASWAVTGDPSPVAAEVSAIAPRFAVVMFGTNDIGWYAELDQPEWWVEGMPPMFRWYGDAYLRLVDGLIAQGIVPVLMSIPPRADSTALNRWVPTVNAFVRAVAETRGIPFVDFHLALAPLPDFGLWPDGVHPDVAPGGACDFSAAGLEHGQNVRNLLTIEVLDRLRQTLLLGEAAPDTGSWHLEGSGTVADPLVIDSIPFSDWRSTTSGPSDRLDSYPNCSRGQDESGPEVFYRLSLAQPTRLRAMVLDVGSVDVDIHLLDSSGGADGCLVRNDTLIQGTFEPGTYYIVADTFVSAVSGERDGDFLLVVTTCEPGDPACD